VKTTLRRLMEMKRSGSRIAGLGVYDAPMAAIADEIGFELFIIGNSGPMSLFGYRQAARVPAADLEYMTAAVSRVTRYALVVSTMPYMSYLVSKEEGIRTAARLVSEAGAECVQCHGSADSAENIAAIVRAGIPVLAHLGLQSVRKTEQSGYRVRGGTAAEAHQIVRDAMALADAGVFAFILELVPLEVVRHLRKALSIPVLSLGSGPHADGIYQVSADVVGFSAFRRPSTSAQFCDAEALAQRGLQGFIDSVRARTYPQPNPNAHMAAADIEKLALLTARI
jgi:3-methyl-2-oxobutanoate hydroxymethyltransferase